jgi:hypothetical protein
VVSSASPRVVGGKPSKNPRYLQLRPDRSNPVATALADIADHLLHHRALTEFAPLPVDIIAAGRRNNPPEADAPALCSYNPLHYMELPELFLEFISSMTGKSPSTTGAGSEGALTKGPFNMLPSIIDLNAAFLSYALTGYDGWISSAGYIGPKVRVDHDFSLLVPEVFSRMSPAERDAAWLLENGYLDPIEDVERDGRTIEASRLGYRINHTRDAQARAAGRRRVRGLRRGHRRDAPPCRPVVPRRRHHRHGDPAAARTVAVHGRRPLERGLDVALPRAA